MKLHHVSAALVSAAVFLAAAPDTRAGDGDIVNSPTSHAWKIFAEINSDVPGDAQGRVVWEMWIRAADVFARPAVAPQWPDTAGPGLAASDRFEAAPLQNALRAARMQKTLPDVRPVVPAFDPTVGTSNETRMNRAAFDFIIANDLYFVEGIEAFRAAGRSLTFPIAAIEIKAQWRRIREADAARYHVAKVPQAGGAEQIWGLTALHITTKELPNWFWATWEHRDNVGREDVIPDLAPQNQPENFRGTKWENYVLRGTQIDFTDSIGRPTRLANSQIEGPFQATSSCITCHALATAGPPNLRLNGLTMLPIFTDEGDGFIGVPRPDWFFQGTVQDYTQLDFVWAFARAQRRNPTP